ncbi:hypothetical protein [Mucilaginibacter sp.]|uniref:hypothetical protein n=1 Tax=Mucilaginibacter sp. TaxID=1882438 RepID=UPI002ECFAF04
MRIKLLFTCLLFILLKCTCYGQEAAPAYTLLKPENWHIETFVLPPQFAATLPVKGIEDIRFSPDWAKKGTEGYWTYGFLWIITNKAPFTKTQLEKYMCDYYTGLAKANLKKAKIDTAIATPVKVKLRNIKAGNTDTQTFEGKAEMTDYMTQDSLILNFRIHVKKAKSGSNVTAVYFEASPQPYKHKIWVQLDELDKSL